MIYKGWPQIVTLHDSRDKGDNTHTQHNNKSRRMPISGEVNSGELWLVIDYADFPPQGISL